MKKINNLALALMVKLQTNAIFILMIISLALTLSGCGANSGVTAHAH